ncbi:MAG: porin [Gemmatimonadota bacterium]
MARNALSATLLLVAASTASGQTSADSARRQPAVPAAAWYQRLSLRGYAHLRYNRLFETNSRLTCAHCDRSIGGNGGLFLRRGRLVLGGDVSTRLSIYIQTDYATEASGSQQLLQIRDAYFDLHVDSARNHRLRFGQSKVLYSFENLQSASNRYAIDRSDAINSGAPNERDLGVFYLWTSASARRRFRILTDSGLKGSGDYGVFAFGVYNGQTTNRAEANNSLHTVARVAWPFRLPNGQFVEASLSGYSGRFVLLSRTPSVAAQGGYADQRVAAALVIYPQPIGFQAEWNVGEGPQYSTASRSVVTSSLRGGYVQLSARTTPGAQTFTPYVRLQDYDGGRKTDLDARHHVVREFEAGVEWIPWPSFEFTMAFASMKRQVADGTVQGPTTQKGSLLRLQAQFAY